jgi:hypothetical protein
MKHRLYSSTGNSVGLESYLGYFEIGPDANVTRYIEIGADGTALRYSEEFPADQFGQLSEGPIDEVEASKPEYGVFVPITAVVFQAIWINTICKNRAI